MALSTEMEILSCLVPETTSVKQIRAARIFHTLDHDFAGNVIRDDA